MQISYRKACPGDEYAIALVGAATFLESFSGEIDGDGLVRHCTQKHSAQTYADALNAENHAIWLVEQAPGRSPVGYLHLTAPSLPIPTLADDVEVKRIYLLSKMQGQGIGKKLLNYAIDYSKQNGSKRVLIGVYDGNEKAIKFYKDFGFSCIGERDFDVGGVTYHDWIYAYQL